MIKRMVSAEDRYATLLREAAVAAVPKMLRPAEGKLRHPYLQPGGGYRRQLWDWDSFWATVAVLQLFGDPVIGPRFTADFRRMFLDHVAGSLRNFFDHQGSDGSLPINMTPACGDVFSCTVRPTPTGEETNMGKPVFGQMLLAYTRAARDYRLARTLFPPLKRFHACWRTRYLDRCGLFVWGSDVAIGVDDGPTTWARPPFSSANLLPNVLMCEDLRAAARIAGMLGRTKDAAAARTQASALAAAIRRHCWDERDGFYYTVDVQCRRRTALGWVHRTLDAFWETLPLKVLVWTGFLTMWGGIATRTQARRMVREHLMDPGRFLSPFGVRAISRDEQMYQPEIKRGNPSNWLGPVWILPNWIVWRGLLRYGYRREAAVLSRRIVALLGRDLTRTDTLHEYYSPETGRGVNNPGFWNWNLLAIDMIRGEP